MIDEFKTTAELVQQSASQLGVKPKSDFVPALDPKSIGIGVGAITLHEGDIPFRLGGLGDRRLVALGLQLLCVKQGAVLLIDEVEHALEPYRIRHLLREFQQLTDQTPAVGQIIMTSHSHTVVVELASERLCVVRSENGTTTVRDVGSALQSTARSVPEALLSRKIIVCEGKTEYGFCRSLENYWVGRQRKLPLAYYGTVLVEGGGDPAPRRALELRTLGYDVCLFLDSDKLNDLNPDLQTLADAKIKTVCWEGCVSIEERIALDIPWATLELVLALAIDIKGEQSAVDGVCSALEANREDIGVDINDWSSRGYSDEQIRQAIGQAAKKGKWFKRIDRGEELGNIVVQALESMPGCVLTATVEELGKWVYE